MKSFLLTFFIFSSIFSYSQEFSLEAKVISKTVVFRKAYLEREGKTDSVEIINDSFSFKGIVPQAAEGTLRFDAFEHYEVDLAIFPGRTHITLLPSAMNFKILGPPAYSLFKEFEKDQKRTTTKYAMMHFAAFRKVDNSLSDSSSEEFRVDSMLKLIDGLNSQLDTLYEGWTKKSVNTQLFPIVLKTWAKKNSESELLLNTVVKYSAAFPNDTLLTRMKKELSGELITGGKEAPLFTLPDTLSKNIALKSFRGKYVLVDFWASWCGPCRKENPNVVSAYNKFSGRNFTVLGVALEEEGAKDVWLKAIRKDGLPWTQVTDFKGWESPVAKLYNVESIPQNFLISPEGKIIATNLRGPKLHRVLDKVLPK